MSPLYRVNGLLVSSPFAFAGVPVDNRPAAEADVTISLDGIPDSVPKTATTGWHAQGEVFLIDIPQVARYLIRRGREILVEPCSGAQERDIQFFLSGLAFRIVCYQRGLFPLHASAVRVGGGCVAFAGPSGAGKSTLAAFLVHHGYPLVSDDTCVITCPPTGPLLAYPSFPRLKLWLNSLRVLQQPSETLARCYSRLEKYYLPVEAGLQVEPLPLWRIYVLRGGETVSEHGIERIRGLDAMAALANNTQEHTLIRCLGLAVEHFKFCTQVTGMAEIYRFSRPLGFEHMDRVVEDLKAHWGGGRRLGYPACG